MSSIPITARRYISELGLTSRKWSEPDIHNDGKSTCILICEKGGRYRVVVGQFIYGAWRLMPDSSQNKIHGIVCWSEIKI